MPQPWQQHLEQSHGKDRKSALQLLQEIVRDGNAALCDDVLELAGMNGRTDADSMRQCYYMSAVYTAQAAVNTTRTIVQAAPK